MFEQFIDRFIDRFPLIATIISGAGTLFLAIAGSWATAPIIRFIWACPTLDLPFKISLILTICLLALLPSAGWFYLCVCAMDPPENPNRSRWWNR